jgi:selenocysteine-specific elongation factor
LADLAVDAEVVGALVHLGRIMKVNDTSAFQAATYHAMVDWVLATIDATGSVTVAGLRDQFGTSRKHALALLEHLDQQRVTRRQGDARVRW